MTSVLERTPCELGSLGPALSPSLMLSPGSPASWKERALWAVPGGLTSSDASVLPPSCCAASFIFPEVLHRWPRHSSVSVITLCNWHHFGGKGRRLRYRTAYLCKAGWQDRNRMVVYVPCMGIEGGWREVAQEERGNVSTWVRRCPFAGCVTGAGHLTLRCLNFLLSVWQIWQMQTLYECVLLISFQPYTQAHWGLKISLFFQLC